jgi:glutamate N-acetyltransferase/amino-acid N-acetyltransferase
MKEIIGGVCAPKGFRCAGIHCGIRKNKTKKDLALIVSDTLANSCAVYTTNLVKGAPLIVTKNNLSGGKAQAMICNSGNANTCNANGIEIAQGMCKLVENSLGIPKENVIVASTGVIGQPLSLEPIISGMDSLVNSLGDNSADASEAIMTTDTIIKEFSISFDIAGTECRIGGIAKGSGMIHPNMATLLVFLTTDTKICTSLLSEAIKEDVNSTFNMVSVDGDTSTNDMLSIMANGMANNIEIAEKGKDYDTFCSALNLVTTYLCKLIAKDGEGATKLIECEVLGAKDNDNAKLIAKSVITSSLFKSAMFGADANWGRVLCAIGYSLAVVDVNKIDVSFSSANGTLEVCKSGSGVDFNEEIAKIVLSCDEIKVTINCNQGFGASRAWGCDLTYEYVRINGDYRT